MAARNSDKREEERIEDPAPLEEEQDLEELEEEVDEEEAEEEVDDEGREEEPEPETVEQLQERLAKVESERDGYRRDMFRMRERQRLARQRSQMQALYDEPEERTEDDEGQARGGGARVKVEMDPETGDLLIDPDDIVKATQKAVTPRGRQRNQMHPAAQAVQQATAEYVRNRQELIEDADDPIAVSDRLDELELAYQHLDRMVGQAVMDIGAAPQGEDGLIELIETEGISGRFQRRFPGIDYKKLIHAPRNRRVLTELVHGSAGKSQESREDEAQSRAEQRRRALRTGDRPRTVRRGRRKAEPGVSVKKYDELDPEDFLNLTDEEIAEYERSLQ